MPQYDDYQPYDDESVEAPRAPRPQGRRRPSRPEESDEIDPLDDPRAPRNLRRSPPPARRSGPPPENQRGGAGYAGERRRSRPTPDDSAEMPYSSRDGGNGRRGSSRGSRPRAHETRDERGSYGSRSHGGSSRPRPYPDQRERYDSRGGGYEERYDPRYDHGYGDGYDESAAYSAYDPAPSEEYPAPRGRPHGARGQAAMWLSASLPIPGPGKQKRRVPVVLLLVIALMVLAVPGVLFGPKLVAKLQGSGTGATHLPKGTFTPGPTPTVQPHFKKFISDRSLYSIDYPDTWAISSKEQTVQGQYDHVDVFAPATQGAVNQMLVEQAAAAAQVSDAQVIASEVAGAQQGGVTFKPTADQPVPVNIGGEFWQRQDFTVSGGGVTVHEAILAGHHQGRSYVIVLVSSTAAFSGDFTKYFNPALKSFRFN